MTRRAFTMIDVLVTLAVMAIVVLAAIPSLSSDNRTRVLAATNLFVADLNNARALSIQDPADAVRVVLHPRGEGYYLARASDPETPIDLPTGIEGEYSIVFGEGDHGSLEGVTIAPEGADAIDIVDGGLPEIVFDAFGRLSPRVDQRIVIRGDNADPLTVVIRADTGDAYIE